MSILPKLFYRFNVIPTKIPRRVFDDINNVILGNFLAVQWLGLCDFTAKGSGSIPGWGTKIPQAVRCSQKKKKM